MIGCFMIVILLAFGTVILYKAKIREARLAKFKEKYPSETTATYLKYDNPSVKKCMVCTIVMGVWVLLTIVFMNWDVIYLDLGIGLAILIILLGLFFGIPLFLYFLYHMLAGLAYLKRLEKNGYEAPRDRDIYESVLERLPKTGGMELDVCCSDKLKEQPESGNGISKTSKRLFIVCLCMAVLMLGCTGYYMAKWYFMGEDAVAMLVFQLIGDLFWILPTGIFYKQMDTKKYKDDVEIDCNRKDRFNMVSGLTLLILLGLIALGIKYSANNMTAFVHSSRIMPDGQMTEELWDSVEFGVKRNDFSRTVL